MTESSQVPERRKKPTFLLVTGLLVILVLGFWLSSPQRSGIKTKTAASPSLDLPSAVVPQPTMQPVMVNENPFPAAPARLRD